MGKRPNSFPVTDDLLDAPDGAEILIDKYEAIYRRVGSSWELIEEPCFWCNRIASEAAKQHEGPHLTWCPHFRESQRGGVTTKLGFNFYDLR